MNATNTDKGLLVHGVQVTLSIIQNFFDMTLAGNCLVDMRSPFISHKLLIGSQLGANSFKLSLPLDRVHQRLQNVVVGGVHRGVHAGSFFELNIFIYATGSIIFNNVVIFVVIIGFSLFNLNDMKY